MKKGFKFVYLIVLMVLVNIYCGSIVNTIDGTSEGKEYYVDLANKCKGDKDQYYCEYELGMGVRGDGHFDISAAVENKCDSYSDETAKTNCKKGAEDYYKRAKEKYIKKYGMFGEINAGNGFDSDYLSDAEYIDEKAKNVGNRIAGAIFSFLQILAFGGIILAGLRYMYSSSDQKAEIKKSFIVLCCGMILVFGASTVAKFAQKSFNELYVGKDIYINNKKYKVIEYITDEMCNNETINKKVDMDGEKVYCTKSGYCCTYDKGKYSYRHQFADLADDNIELEKTEIKITKKIFIPDPLKYEKVSCGPDEAFGWKFSGTEEDKKEVEADIWIKADNTGIVHLTSAQQTSEYTLRDGIIYRNNTGDKGSCQSGFVFEEKVYEDESLLYENAVKNQ